MPRKNKSYLIILAQIIYLFFILIILPTIFLKEKPGIYQTSFEDILSLNINNSYIQQFIADRENLNSVSVLLKNPELKSNDQITIEVQNNKKETLQLLNTSGVSVADPSWVNFKFPIINSKKGDIFYLKISSNSQKDNLLYIYGDKNTKNINFKTSFTAKNIKESFNNNLNQQINNFKSRNIFQTISYLSLLLLTNIFIFI